MKHVAYVLRVCLFGARIYKYYALREYSYSFVDISQWCIYYTASMVLITGTCLMLAFTCLHEPYLY